MANLRERLVVLIPFFFNLDFIPHFIRAVAALGRKLSERFCLEGERGNFGH